MKLIDRNDIENWAERFDSKGNLPTLVSRLVRATTPFSTQTDFPSGSAAFIGGWDGIVNCQEDSAFVPKGISLWEFGTEAGSRGKANDDYEKRTLDPLGYNKSQCTFIFVTPRCWNQKNKWCKEKQEEKIWKDVKVYDSLNIEQWLDNAAAVSRWFSSYLSKYPSDGIITIEEFWKEWALCDKGELPPSVVTSGREFESKQLLSFLSGPSGIQGIQASSKDEAIAFIIASAKQFDEHNREMFFSKSLVINNAPNFRSVRINTNKLNLIARFEEPQVLFAAASEGHHVLLPMGPDDNSNQKIIPLPTIDRDGQSSGLIDMGLYQEDAEKYSKESGRNITILKKLLGFPHNKTKWIETEDIREIIPAILVGRWNETFVGDKEIIERISGIEYDEYSKILLKWRDLEESPLIQIGETWRLTSPLDAWINLAPYFSKKDFELLKECFLFAFINGNPQIERNEDVNSFSMLFSKEKTFSNWSREGLVQSLILVGLHGEGLKIPQMPSPQSWVDNIIRSLLFEANGDLWVSVNHEMPLISEASPNSFFEAVNESLSQKSPPIMNMFIEEAGFISSNSNQTGLLWALESLAWMPEYLYNASSILLKLDRLDPGGNLSNRPNNSIIEIFKPWHYQTLSSYDERMEILKQITIEEIGSGWSLLIRMLPDHHGIAHPTHKMRWRMFGKNSNIDYTYEEIWNTHSFVVGLLISHFDFTEQKFAQLIEESENLSPQDRDIILEFAKTNYSKVEQTEYTTWHTIRKILSRHRSNPSTDWAMPEHELLKYEELYKELEPTDTIHKYIWLFNDYWPEFPEGFIYDNEALEKKQIQQQKKIDNARIEGLTNIIAQFELDKVKELSKIVKEPWSLGVTLARIIDDEPQIFTITEFLNNEKGSLSFIHNFLSTKIQSYNVNWAFSIFKKLQEKGYSNKALAQLFVPANQTKELWAFIDSTNEEIKKEYWLSMQPSFYHINNEEKIHGINNLVHYQRFYTAIDICTHFSDEMPTELLVRIMRKSATEEANENIQMRGYEIGRLFETISKRSDIDHQTLIQLEWLFLPVLDSYGTSRSPKLLHDELSKNPDFFIDILKWVYMPKNKEFIEEERKDVTDEAIINKAKLAYQLLHSWKKIPGVNPDNSIDEEFLSNWVKTVRILAEKVDRLEVAEAEIGKVLAQYPETILNWPTEPICNIIESINTDSIKRNFSSALYNKRGSSIRGPFDGGNIERGHAEYFEDLAIKHKKKHPNIASIFSRLAKGYFVDAKRMDERAERDRLEY